MRVLELRGWESREFLIARVDLNTHGFQGRHTEQRFGIRFSFGQFSIWSLQDDTHSSDHLHLELDTFVPLNLIDDLEQAMSL